MSRKSSSNTVSVLAKSVFAVGFVVGALQSCGSSSSSDATALCQQSCDKALACTPDAGSIGATADMSCKTNCAAQTATANKCSNLSAIEGAVKACLAMDCASFETCIETTVPDCATATGSGGSNGTGSGGSNGTGNGGSSGTGNGGSNGGGAGTNGAGGGTGSASCSICTKAETCCVALEHLVTADAGSCGLSAAQCNTLSGTAQTQYISTCNLSLSTGSSAGVAACQ
jgi:hypothetical protein